MTTNKFYRKDAIINVYVVNLDEYDKCNLVEDYTPSNSTEAWVSLPIEENDWKDFLKTIGNPEEYVIHDYKDNLGLNGIEITQHMSLEKLNELGERMGEISPSEVDAFNALYEALDKDFEEALDIFESEDYAFYGNMTMEEVMRRDGYYETEYGIICLE